MFKPECIYPQHALLVLTSGFDHLITEFSSTPPLKETPSSVFLIMSLATSPPLPSLLLNPKVSCVWTKSTKLHSQCISNSGTATMRYSITLAENCVVVNDNATRLTTRLSGCTGRKQVLQFNFKGQVSRSSIVQWISKKKIDFYHAQVQPVMRK